MASKTGVRTELYRDQFGVLLEDLDHQLLELKWLEGSASMTDDDFRAWLDRFSAEAETRRQPHLVINVREFRHRPGPEIAAWRDEHLHSAIQPGWRDQVRFPAPGRLAWRGGVAGPRAARLVSDGIFRHARQNRGLV